MDAHSENDHDGQSGARLSRTFCANSMAGQVKTPSRESCLAFVHALQRGQKVACGGSHMGKFAPQSILTWAEATIRPSPRRKFAYREFDWHSRC